MLAIDREFQLTAPHSPTGDQPAAIAGLTSRLTRGDKAAVLLGATGTGKTFTMANVIAETRKPTLIISHNKTLAAQLFEEMRELFPQNAVSYFVSYYDYYQPEAYIPQRDIYIEKDASRNADLDRLRLAATSSLLSRRDVIVVASVSCIFGLGSPDQYKKKVVSVTKGQMLPRRDFLLALSAMQYQRNDIDFARSTYRVKGDTIDVYPAYEQHAVRFELFGDEVENILLIDPLSGEVLAEEKQTFIFPAVHYVVDEEIQKRAIESIREELTHHVKKMREDGKLLEAQRLLSRTKYDLEMIEELGYCQGVENYSRHLDGRLPGEMPHTLMDYFANSPGAQEHGWLCMIDESHVTLPQIRAMYNGDQARKKVLVEHGFRLPSALDNRPLQFSEFETVPPQILYVSATPGPYELEHTGGEVVEQIIRPTGLVDPEVEVRPADTQVPDLLEQCRATVKEGGRVLVTALTKRLCEQLTTYLDEQGLRVRYLHSEIETLDRVEILRALRAGEYDILVGVNLLREGLDLPEVSLVCILDADKEGFLRSPTSLIQQMGRAARNVDSRVIMYADKMTAAMQTAIGETDRRRAIQLAYNEEHNITPTQIVKALRDGLEQDLRARRTARAAVGASDEQFEASELAAQLEAEMLAAAEAFEFEKAAKLRDQVRKLKGGAPDRTVTRSQLDSEAPGPASEPGAPGAPPRRKKNKRKPVR